MQLSSAASFSSVQLSDFGARDSSEPPGSLEDRAKEVSKMQKGGQLTSGCPAHLAGICSHLQVKSWEGHCSLREWEKLGKVCAQPHTSNSPGMPDPGKSPARWCALTAGRGMERKKVLEVPRLISCYSAMMTRNLREAPDAVKNYRRWTTLSLLRGECWLTH